MLAEENQRRERKWKWNIPRRQKVGQPEIPVDTSLSSTSLGGNFLDCTSSFIPSTNQFKF
ncbi:hypothetical protein V2J09_022830 [Rumex salicifolius]